jgi:tetratricopeptide (TPR) repeat protein
LLSDAAPSGKPFTTNDLLDRAKNMVEMGKPSLEQIELLDWIGKDYDSHGQHAQARPILERAYQLSRQFTDSQVRASAACALADELSHEENLARGEALFQEGFRELPNEPEYALARANCLRYGSAVSRENGESSEAVRRMETARQILRASPLDSDTFEVTFSVELANAYWEAGRYREALVEFQRSGDLLSSLGRNGTQQASTLYNNWAVVLDQVGRPLEAEKAFRRAIDISLDGSTKEAATATTLDNYAHVLRELDRLPEAADYAERAYKRAVETGDESQMLRCLVERSRIYIAQHDLPRAESMLAQVEPKMRKVLPPGHYAFATISGQRALIAMEKRDLPAALRLTDEGIAAVKASLKSGKGGGYLLPELYTDRSAVNLALGHASEAEADATQALSALHANDGASDVSNKLGRVYLAQARALALEGKSAQARAAASLALVQLEGTVGPDHPDTQSAQLLAK